jgi:acetyl-CoA carboxylase carboxyl transferase subunit alpha
MNLLDFEKPIAELEGKLADMKHLANDSDESVKGAIQALEKKITELKKETFDNLTGWQRVQLSRHPRQALYLRLYIRDHHRFY